MVLRNGFRFNLVSYNILSQSLLNDHLHLYTGCNPKDLEWPTRGKRILTDLLDRKADIICLQEVESDHLQSLYKPKLAKFGYECVYKKKTGFKIDGCAIFFKTRLFHLLNYKGIEFNRKDVSSLLNRDNVGIIAVLKPRFQDQSDSSQLVIANTHLIFNPRRSDIRIAQLKIFLSELDELSFQHFDNTRNERCHHPTILCGDFNSTPDSEVTSFILTDKDKTIRNVDDNETTREVSTDEKDILTPKLSSDKPGFNFLNDYSHSFRFKSVYPIQDTKGQPYVSTFSGCIVDYIFYTPRLRLESYLEMLTEDQLKKNGCIPNVEFPSDHLPLEASFFLRKV